GEDLLPRVVGLERRQVRAADEALRLVVEADAARRGGQALGQRPRQRRERPDAAREEVGDVGVVAAEQLVAPLARERDLDPARRELGYEVRRQRRRVGERLVEGLGQRRQEERRVRPQHELLVVGRVAPRDEPHVGQLVEGALGEADRERPQRLAELLRRERGERRRVDAAREQDADRDVADEVGAHRVAEPGPQLGGQRLLALRPLLARGRRRRPRVATELDRAVLPGQQVTRRQLADLAEDRERRGDRVEGEEALERVEVDLAARQGAQLGSERELAAGVPVGERLDAVAVASEHEPPPLPVPDRDREHPAQPLREAVAVLLVEMQDHLGVAVRSEAVTRALQLGPELAVVVYLAVLDDPGGAVLVRDRLVARLEVDDREPPRREPDRPVDVRAVAVGAAVDERPAHRGETGGIDVAGGDDDPADAAHAATLTRFRTPVAGPPGASRRRRIRRGGRRRCHAETG